MISSYHTINTTSRSSPREKFEPHREQWVFAVLYGLNLGTSDRHTSFIFRAPSVQFPTHEHFLYLPYVQRTRFFGRIGWDGRTLGAIQTLTVRWLLSFRIITNDSTNKIKNHKLQHRIWKIRWSTCRYNPDQCTKNGQKIHVQFTFILWVQLIEKAVSRYEM